MGSAEQGLEWWLRRAGVGGGKGSQDLEGIWGEWGRTAPDTPALGLKAQKPELLLYHKP